MITSPLHVFVKMLLNMQTAGLHLITSLDTCLLQVPAIQQRRIVAFFNQFVVHTVRFVNRFAIVCEEVCACLFPFVYPLHLQLQLIHIPFLLSCRNLPTYLCVYSRLRRPCPFWKLRSVLVCRFGLYFAVTVCTDPAPNIVTL